MENDWRGSKKETYIEKSFTEQFHFEVISSVSSVYKRRHFSSRYNAHEWKTARFTLVIERIKHRQTHKTLV